MDFISGFTAALAVFVSNAPSAYTLGWCKFVTLSVAAPVVIIFGMIFAITPFLRWKNGRSWNKIIGGLF